MDDIEFENSIQRLKYQAIQDFTVDEMEYYVMGFKRGFRQTKQKERLQFNRETREAYNMGFNHGKSRDDFLAGILRKKLQELKPKPNKLKKTIKEQELKGEHNV